MALSETELLFEIDTYHAHEPPKQTSNISFSFDLPNRHARGVGEVKG